MSIKKLPNGKYMLSTVDAYGQNIRRRFGNKKDALDLETKIRKEKYDLRLNNLGLKKKRYLFETTLNDFETTKLSLRPKSVQKYKAIIKQIRIFTETLNIKYLDEFTSDHGTLFYNALLEPREVDKGNHKKIMKAAPRTVNSYIQKLKAFFSEEVIKDHIVRSPVLHLKPLRVEWKRPDYYRDEELEKFFAQEMPFQYKHFFLLLLMTGLRFGEARNLTWDNVDLENRIISVRSRDGYKLKTKKSDRNIPISEKLYQVLVGLYKNKQSDIVFLNDYGRPFAQSTTLNKCKKIAKRAGISSRAFNHKFRATLATKLTLKGASMVAIKEYMGHSSVVETEKSYANSKSINLKPLADIADDII